MPIKDPEARRTYAREWHAARRSKWIEANGGRCVQCSSTENLEVDHIDRTLKTMQTRHVWSSRAEIRDRELALCQILCESCHKEKTRAEQRTTTHGDYGMYNKHGCRCELCRGANAARVRRCRQRVADYARAA